MAHVPGLHQTRSEHSNENLTLQCFGFRSFSAKHCQRAWWSSASNFAASMSFERFAWFQQICEKGIQNSSIFLQLDAISIVQIAWRDSVIVLWAFLSFPTGKLPERKFQFKSLDLPRVPPRECLRHTPQDKTRNHSRSCQHLGTCHSHRSTVSKPYATANTSGTKSQYVSVPLVIFSVPC